MDARAQNGPGTAAVDGVAVPLPPSELRTGGTHFVDDADYTALARRDVETLQQLAGLTAASRVLDWGCGAGRLAVGLLLTGAGFAEYVGVDVQPRFLEWCTANLGSEHVRFVRLDAPNARYNPDGAAPARLPAGDGEVDVFFAYSVLSHMLPDDVASYLAEMSRVLTPPGRAVVTAFVEPGVRAWEENPARYGPLAWDGPLHCVRYDEDFLLDLVEAAGLVVEEVRRGDETDGQSLLVLAHAAHVAAAPPGGARP